MIPIRPGDYISCNTDFSFGFEGWVISFEEILNHDPENFMTKFGNVTVLTLQNNIIKQSIHHDDIIQIMFGKSSSEAR